MKRSTERKKAEKIFIDAIVLIAIFALFTVTSYNKNKDHSSKNLNMAVSKYSGGGSVDEKYSYKGGLFVFIKNSSSKEYGYFYKKDNLWYNRKSILTMNYNLKDKYEVTTYYVKEPKYYFIRVRGKGNEIKTISDSNNSKYRALDVVDGDKRILIHFTGTTEALTNSFAVTINGEKFVLSEYNNKKKML